MIQIRAVFVVLQILFFASLSIAQPELVTEMYDGLDPVELLAGTEVPGDEALAVNHGSYRFLFANTANRKVFESNPARYEPAIGGVCARMGPTAAALPALFAVHDGRIYLFGSEECHKLFTATPSRYIDSPSAEPSLTARALAEGRELAARLGSAVGGSAKLHGVAAFGRTMRVDRQTPKGIQAFEERLLVQYPANLRHDRDFPFGTVITAVSAGDAFSVSVDKTGPGVDRRPVPARQALAMHLQERAAREWISVLKTTQDPGAALAAVEPPPNLDASLRYLRIRHGALDAILGVDPKTYRPHLLSYRGRTSAGAFATIVLDLDDDRNVAGLWLPHRVRVRADGVPDPSQSYIVTAWTLNPPLDANAFARPSKGTGAGRQQ
jgi:YHS domain-containing protein